MRPYMGHIEFWRNRCERSLTVFQAVKQMDQFLAILRHLIEQQLGEKARRLRNPEFHRRAAALLHDLQEALIFLRRKVRVELLSQGWNHDRGVVIREGHDFSRAATAPD